MKIVCVGDSRVTSPTIATSWPAELQLLRPQDTVVNKGWPGERSDGLIARLPSVLASEQPDVVIVMIGVNDISNAPSVTPPNTPGLTVKETWDNVRDISQTIKNFSTTTESLITTGLPTSYPLPPMPEANEHELHVAYEIITYFTLKDRTRQRFVDTRSYWTIDDWKSHSDIWQLHPNASGASKIAFLLNNVL